MIKTYRLILMVILFVWPFISLADFIGKKGATLNGHGDWWYQEFSVTGKQQFDFFFTADYSAQAMVFDKADLSAFKNSNSLSVYASFSSTFGVETVTLGSGNYVVGVRNATSSDNTFSVEFEKSPPEIDNGEYVGVSLTDAEYVGANGYLVQPFTIQDGYTYVIEGCNTGLYSYVIPSSNINNFKNNRQFNYYSDYSSDSEDTNQPGLMTLNLSPGDYALAFRNKRSSSKALTYRFYRYRLNNGSSSSSSPSSSSNYLADSVFNDIENNYSYWFSPHQTSRVQDEYYYRAYPNGSMLLEWKGDLWYNIEGEGWNKWGPLSQW